MMLFCGHNAFYVLFLQFIILGFVIAICKKRKSSIDGEVEEDDIVDSDDDMLPA